MVTAHGASAAVAGPHPGARLERRRGDLSARARRPSGGRGARARWLPPGHHRPARPRGGARADRAISTTSTSCSTTSGCATRSTTIRASASPPRRRSRSRGCGIWSALIRQRFPRSDVRFIDTVCKPTKQRQTAAVELARQSDVVIVIGGANSNNTRELVTTCSRYCSRVHHVQTEADLRPEWFGDADTVGITAGTSTPDDVIDRVEQRIRSSPPGRAASTIAPDIAPSTL